MTNPDLSEVSEECRQQMKHSLLKEKEQVKKVKYRKLTSDGNSRLM
jgi:hypothetical protein